MDEAAIISAATTAFIVSNGLSKFLILYIGLIFFGNKMLFLREAVLMSACGVGVGFLLNFVEGLVVKPVLI